MLNTSGPRLKIWGRSGVLGKHVCVCVCVHLHCACALAQEKCTQAPQQTLCVGNAAHIIPTLGWIWSVDWGRVGQPVGVGSKHILTAPRENINNMTHDDNHDGPFSHCLWHEYLPERGKWGGGEGGAREIIIPEVVLHPGGWRRSRLGDVLWGRMCSLVPRKAAGSILRGQHFRRAWGHTTCVAQVESLHAGRQIPRVGQIATFRAVSR